MAQKVAFNPFTGQLFLYDDQAGPPLATTAPPAIAAASAVGTGTDAARNDHTHQQRQFSAQGSIWYGDAGGAPIERTIGASGQVLVSNGSIPVWVSGFAPLTATPPVDVTKAAAAVGVGTAAARDDHKHDVSTAAPSSVGAANAEGSATSLARSDHIHDHGAHSAGTDHAAVSSSAAGFAPVVTGASGYVLTSNGTTSSWAAPTGAPLTATPPVDVTKAAAAVGVGTAAARDDHKHDVSTGVPTDVLPNGSNTEGTATSLARSDHGHRGLTGSPVAVGTANSDGTANSYARSDHVHNHGNLTGGNLHANVSNTAQGFVPIVGAAGTILESTGTAATWSSSYGPLTSSPPADVTKAAAAVGVGTTAARADHKHDVSTATPVSVTVQSNQQGTATSLARSDHRHTAQVDGPVSVGTANTEGTSESLARADHVHNHGSQTSGTLHAAVSNTANGFVPSVGASGTILQSNGSAATWVTGFGALTSTAPVNVTKAAAAVGTGTTAARHDHKHDVTTAAPGVVTYLEVAAEGTATELARADHQHSCGAPANPVNVNASALAVGTAGQFARADHKHQVDAGSPVAVGTANADGTANTLARSDHVHNHGSQTTGTHHAAVSNTTNGFCPAVGASGYVLTSNGSAATWAAPASGGTGTLGTMPFGECNTSVVNLSNGDVYMGWFTPVANFTVNNGRCSVIQTEAAQTVQLGIYTFAGTTATLVATSDTQSCASTGLKTFTFSGGVSLTAGQIYYVGIVASGNSAGVAGSNVQAQNFAPYGAGRIDRSNTHGTGTVVAQGTLPWIELY